MVKLFIFILNVIVNYITNHKTIFPITMDETPITDKSQFIVHHYDAQNLDFRYGSGVDKSAPHCTQIRQSQFWSAIRATPVFVPAFALMNLLYHPSQQALNFVLGTGVVYVVNQGLKFAFRHMYSIPWLEPKLHWLIGQGTRPAGAANTTSFLVYPSKPSSTFGMPSGHSQTAWYLAAYMVGSLVSTTGTTQMHLSLTALVTCTYALLVSYSRVYIDRVHTIQQVILGAILGVLCGVLCI